MFYVYLLRSISHPQQTYIGFTKNLKQRLETHNAGHATHTSKYTPWTLVSFLGFDTSEKAIAFEQYLKTSSGKLLLKKRFW